MNKEKYIEWQILEQQMAQLNENLKQLEKQKKDAARTIEHLEEMRKVKAGTKILVPFANGVFAEAELKSSDSFKVNVGSGICVKKSLDDTKELLSEQLSELNLIIEDTVSYYQQVYERMIVLEKEITAETTEQ
ncbi:MAG: prefoldin subunit alpha [Nanoarchaeota archaeon]|nr:prefoldin subunit alpha [Nanoarchaeota archaeon]MBU1031069.1 prefoldin subunit alpha [Nanoarchaeota archaeon]MBU1850492.1 prefoldin subunit alpha [Nanoarchaeota archaeon]